MKNTYVVLLLILTVIYLFILPHILTINYNHFNDPELFKLGIHTTGGYCILSLIFKVMGGYIKIYYSD